MVQVPISPATQKSYRDCLAVPSAPSYIDTDVPITPTVILNPSNVPIVAVSNPVNPYTTRRTQNVTGSGLCFFPLLGAKVKGKIHAISVSIQNPVATFTFKDFGVAVHNGAQGSAPNAGYFCAISTKNIGDANPVALQGQGQFGLPIPAGSGNFVGGVYVNVDTFTSGSALNVDLIIEEVSENQTTGKQQSSSDLLLDNYQSGDISIA
jgi:hypothetical protein